jgi:hypothetical protein
MMGSGFLAALAALAQPILARVLLALGFSVVTLAGVGGVVSQLRDLLIDKLGDAPTEALAIAGLAGVWDGLAMMLGSVSFAVAYWTATRAVRIAGGGS